MQASYTGLVKFISGETICTIPVYQRNYDWKKSHCEQLFADLEHLIKKEKPEHFIGTVVYKEREKDTFTEQIIIDGQQRITSVILLAKAVYDLSDNAQLRGKIYTAFIKSSSEDEFFKLQTSEFDRETFRKLMNGERFSPTEFSRLYLNYKFFKEKLLDSKYELSAVRDSITKLKIVALKLDNENPQEIFESLNSTGKDLTETELIRNFLLINLNADVQTNLYKTYWLPIERMLRDSETFENFMVQYLVSVRKSSKSRQGNKDIQISKYALYPAFKKYFEKNYSGDKAEQVGNFLADMYDYAEFYSRLLAIKNEKFDSLPLLEKKFYELLYLVGASSSPIILMDLHNKYENYILDERTFTQILNALISYMYRAKICRQTGADTDQNAGNIIKRFEEDKKFNVDSFWEAITAGNGKYNFPGDKQFKDALKSTELCSSFKGKNFKHLKYFFYTIERNINLSRNFSDYENLSVEFIIPQKLPAAWINYLHAQGDSQAEQFLNSLGNLVITSNAPDKKAPFSEKRKIFATSEFSYTKDLFKTLNWTSRQIKIRTEELAELALHIWTLPEKYNRLTVDLDIFTLDADFKIFTNTTPAILSISEKEYRISYWIDLLRRIVQELYNLDEDIFRQVIQDDWIKKFFSANPEKLTSPYKIDENLYLGVSGNTQTALKCAKIVVENFDNLSSTNYKENIWFTLKD
ncbi:MAG: DUF262 domain-containing protein [Selenomonadaceae bacterium]|nr:DUF262 domain-containing protein [Selenomonadaceae bacterium]